MKLLNITDPNIFINPNMQYFMLRSLATSPLMPDADAALLEIVDLLHTGLLGVFVTCDDDWNLHGMALVENNPSALSPGCTVLHFVNDGNHESRKLLIQAIIEFARSGGYTKIRGFDVNHKPAAFARLFKACGRPSSLGEIFEFEREELSQ